jgi:hypothetical protein
MLRYTTLVITLSTKQNTLKMYCVDRVQKTLKLGLYLAPSVTARLLLFPEILTSLWLACLNRWKTALSLNIILALKSLFVFMF